MSGRMRLLGLVIALPVVGALAVWGLGYAEFAARALPVGVGLSAKQLCSLHFVSGLPVDRARALYVDRIVEPLPPFLEVEVDAETRTLVASGLGASQLHGSAMATGAFWTSTIGRCPSRAQRARPRRRIGSTPDTARHASTQPHSRPHSTRRSRTRKAHATLLQ